MAESGNNVDKFLSKLKNNKVIASLIVFGIIIISLATFTDSFLQIFNLFAIASSNSTKIQILKDDGTKYLLKNNVKPNFNFLDDDFTMAFDSVSDMLNISKDGISVDMSAQGSWHVLECSKLGIEILPHNNYIQKVIDGGPIWSFDMVSFHIWNSPFLDFKVVNNSKETIF